MHVPYRLRGLVQISLLRARHQGRYLLGLAGAVASAVLLAVDPPWTATGALLALSLLSLAQGLLSLGLDTASVWRDGHRTYLSPADRGRAIEGMVMGDACHGWRPRRFRGRHYVTDQAVNDRLVTEDVALEVRPGRFGIPPAIAEHAGAILAAKYQAGAALYDSVVMRLVSDVCVDDRGAAVQEARYFAGECTNETVGLDVYRRENGSRGRRVFSGASLLAENGVVFDVASSPCANHIGVSTLAFTEDSRLVVVHQSRRSAQSPGLLAPSGSGSAEPRDAAGAGTMQAFLARAMERELFEECGLEGSGAGVRTLVVGYSRDLHRGGKPEFFGVSRVDVPYAALSRSRRERTYVEAIDPAAVKLRDPADLARALARFREDRESEFSLALHVNVLLLTEALGRHWEHVEAVLRPPTREVA